MKNKSAKGVDGAERDALLFMEENAELVDNPEVSSQTLEKIIVDGSALSVALSEEVTCKSELAVESKKRLDAAVLDPNVSPKQVQALSLTAKNFLAKAESATDTLTYFLQFIQRAGGLYYKTADPNQLAYIGERGDGDVEWLKEAASKVEANELPPTSPPASTPAGNDPEATQPGFLETLSGLFAKRRGRG